jgi:branched-chain amino acid transport system ATP-binding protein
MSLLSLQQLQVAYGGIRAVKGIDIEVGAGELVCLIGANGAGKTTTLKAITGLVRAAAGRILYDGEDIGGKRVHEIARRGLALVPEGRGVFAQLTIEENLAMGAYARNDKGAVAADVDRVFGLFPRLKERRTQTAGTLSGGEQQMLAIARGLMARPLLLTVDEPSLGLAPKLVEKTFQILEKIHQEKVTILLVEQNVYRALTLADRAYVIENGRIVMEGRGTELLKDEHLKKSYLGM